RAVRADLHDRPDLRRPASAAFGDGAADRPSKARPVEGRRPGDQHDAHAGAGKIASDTGPWSAHRGGVARSRLQRGRDRRSTHPRRRVGVRKMLDQPLATSKMISEKDGPIGRLIFNNPARHNAVSLEMWQAVTQIMDD